MPFISRSIWRKLLATVVAMVAFVLLYQATILDSRNAATASLRDARTLFAGSRLPFEATAYCKGTTTASGVNVRTGIAAADPDLLPVGSVVGIATGDAKYSGVYTIMDTGPKVQGTMLDLYMWSCHEALAFGRRHIQITVLRLGWNPRASSPGLIDTLFRRRRVRKPPPPPETPPVLQEQQPAAPPEAPVEQPVPEPAAEEPALQ